jgi:xylan 1,4-beta-xylosidase
MLDFTCDFSQKPVHFDHHWEHTVGSGHATLALRADWQRQLLTCARQLGFRHVRFHALLSDDMGTLLCENNKLLYSFFNADQIIDYLLSIGVRPFIELSFMPATLASGSKIVFHYQANATPPNDYGQWATLISKLVSHFVERYGAKEVSQWFFEVWNEPNLTAFWTGKQQDYFRLYRYTVEAIKGVDPSLRVGGPVTAMNAWIEDFVHFVESNHLPADFISTHIYPTDPFGKIGDDTISQLANSSSDVMIDHARETQRQAKERPIYYTEWSTSSNPRDHLHDEPFAAALATKIVMGVNCFVEGYSWWTFSDIFEENYFPSVPFQGGFGLLNIEDIPKPVYRAFELLHRLGDELLPTTGGSGKGGKGGSITVDGWAVRKGHALAVLITNHAMPRHPINTELVHFQIKSAPKPRAAYVERIDEYHANATRMWREIGSPEYLSRNEVSQLQAASELAKEAIGCRYDDGTIHLEIAMPPHSVAAVTVELTPEESNRGQV